MWHLKPTYTKIYVYAHVCVWTYIPGYGASNLVVCVCLSACLLAFAEGRSHARMNLWDDVRSSLQLHVMYPATTCTHVSPNLRQRELSWFQFHFSANTQTRTTPNKHGCHNSEPARHCCCVWAQLQVRCAMTFTLINLVYLSSHHMSTYLTERTSTWNVIAIPSIRRRCELARFFCCCKRSDMARHGCRVWAHHVRVSSQHM